MEFADILKTFDQSLPCGEDLEYDPGFLQLQQMAVGRSEQQFGATIIPAQAPDWRAVERLALGLLERTQDIRIIGYLTQAWTEMRGLPGYAEGVALAAGALERHWDDVHPRVAVDGEEDPMPRMNALASLGDVRGCGRSARSACVVDDMHGQLSLREAEALLDGSKADADYPGGRARLAENLRQAWLQGDAPVMAVEQAAEALRRIQAQAEARLGAAWRPDYAAVLRALDVAQGAWRAQPVSEATPVAAAAGPAPVATAAETALAVPMASVREAAVRWQDLRINTREEAAAMLSKVCDYFEAHEPSHPAPYLIRRAQQLIPLGFHEILRNLAPQGLEQFEAWTVRETDGGPRA